MYKYLFKTKEEAKQWLLGNGFKNNGKCYVYSSTYYLKHGEYEAPDLKIRKLENGYGIKIIYYFYPGTFGAYLDHYLTPEEISRYEIENTL